MAKKPKRAKPRASELRFAGLDLAPNHSAYVEIDANGEVCHVAFITEKVKIAKAHPSEGSLFHSTKERDALERPDYQLKRLLFVGDWLAELIELRRPSFASVEGYAYNKRSGAYDMGEIGGQARRVLARAGVPFQLVTPGELKSFAGIRSKSKPIAACLDRYGVDWTRYGVGLKDPDTVGDLADAHMLAHMCRRDHGIKQGEEPSTELMRRVSDRPWLTES